MLLMPQPERKSPRTHARTQASPQVRVVPWKFAVPGVADSSRPGRDGKFRAGIVAKCPHAKSRWIAMIAVFYRSLLALAISFGALAPLCAQSPIPTDETLVDRK